MSTLVITGRLGGDAELKYTQNNVAVCSFSVAEEIRKGDKKETQWVKCALFGKRGEPLHRYLTKGTIVEVSGRPSVNAWMDKEKNPRASLEMAVSDITLHGGGKKDEPVADKGRATRGSAPMRDDMDDSIPFSPEWR